MLNIRTFEKKKFKICSKIAKVSYFWNFKFWFAAGIGRKLADMLQEGRISPQVFPKLFLCQTEKNWRIYLKKTYPPKKGLFFWGGGGGSGDRWSLRTMCLRLLCCSFFSFEIFQRPCYGSLLRRKKRFHIFFLSFFVWYFFLKKVTKSIAENFFLGEDHNLFFLFFTSFKPEKKLLVIAPPPQKNLSVFWIQLCKKKKSLQSMQASFSFTLLMLSNFKRKKKLPDN